jgi:hypothetical protein
MLLTYFLNDFEMVPVAPIITGITFVFYIPHALYFYCRVFIYLLIIIIIIIILCISFMQGIYIYIPETNHAPRDHCVATILM